MLRREHFGKIRLAPCMFLAQLESIKWSSILCRLFNLGIDLRGACMSNCTSTRRLSLQLVCVIEFAAAQALCLSGATACCLAALLCIAKVTAELAMFDEAYHYKPVCSSSALSVLLRHLCRLELIFCSALPLNPPSPPISHLRPPPPLPPFSSCPVQQIATEARVIGVLAQPQKRL